MNRSSVALVASWGLLAAALSAARPADVGAIIGAVTNQDGEAVGAAHVALANGAGVPVRGGLTGPDGTFRFEQVPAGNYRIGVRKNGYPDVVFGRLRASSPGALVPIQAGEIRRVAIRITLGATISGVVTDHRGRPVMGAYLRVRSAGADAHTAGRTWRTNSRGEYRVWALPAGDYIILAWRDGLDGEITVPNERGELQSRMLSARFYPNASSADEAARVSVSPGQQASGIDITIAPSAAGRIDGVVEGLLPGAQPGSVRLLRTWGDARWSGDISAPVGVDGRFTIRGVPSGMHTVVYQALSAVPDERVEQAVPHWGVARSWVSADQPTSVIVPVTRGGTISGRLVVESDAQPDPSLFGVQVNTISGPFARAQRGGYGERRDGWEFGVSGVAPGTFDVTTYGPDGWWTLAALIGDVDVHDVPREVGPGDDIANLRVVITNRVSGIKGVLRPADGSPAVEHEIVVFPFERRYWRAGARRIRLVQPDIEGQFEVLELPPGDYAVAVNRDPTIDPVNEPAGLDGLLGTAVKVPVRLGQTTTVTLPMR